MVGHPRSRPRGTSPAVIAFLDSNVVVHHLTQTPPRLGVRATALLRDATRLYLTDVVIAEIVFVLERALKVGRPRVAEIVHSLLAMPNIVVVDKGVIGRALRIYQRRSIHFVEAYLVATAESTGVDRIASFDRAIDRIPTVTRVELV